MTQKDESAISRALNKLVPAALFLFLAFMWSDASTMLRWVFAAAGIAFLVEGIVKYVKAPGKGGLSGESSATDDP